MFCCGLSERKRQTFVNGRLRLLAGGSKSVLWFRELHPRRQVRGPIPVEITEGFSGRMLLEKLNIPEEKAFSFLVNGIHKTFDVILSNGDRVSIFPAVGGG